MSAAVKPAGTTAAACAGLLAAAAVVSTHEAMAFWACCWRVAWGGGEGAALRSSLPGSAEAELFVSAMVVGLLYGNGEHHHGYCDVWYLYDGADKESREIVPWFARE